MKKFQNIDLSDIGDVVILDADGHVVYSPFNDIDSMPHEAVCINMIYVIMNDI